MAATRLSFSYPEEMKNAIQKLADKDSRSLSSYVQRVLTKHIEQATGRKAKKKKKRTGKAKK